MDSIRRNEGGAVTWSAEWAVKTPNGIQVLEDQHMTTGFYFGIMVASFRFIKVFIGKVQ
jgi:hypothetical protein